jgi:hypothetical protein
MWKKAPCLFWYYIVIPQTHLSRFFYKNFAWRHAAKENVMERECPPPGEEAAKCARIPEGKRIVF